MIELLIVVAVMVILIGIALPVMKTGIEGRKLREAARQVNTAVTLAKSLAAETDRYAGLLIDVESLPEDQTKLFARRLYLAETPPPYAGDIVGATATITGPFQATFDANSANLINVVKVRDFIRFDHRNPYYEVKEVNGSTPPFVLVLDPLGPPFWPSVVSPPLPPLQLPYEIIRNPEKSSSTPFELPSGAVIDLNNSGFGLTDLRFSRAAPASWTASTTYPRGSYCQANGICYYAVVGGISGTTEPTWPNTLGAWVLDGTAPSVVRWQCVPPRPVTVAFGPSGRVTRVMGLTPELTTTPTETLHLLVGDLENIGALNLANRAGLWLSVGHHTGRITTAENAGAPAVWSASTTYTAGAYCQPTNLNGLCFIATAAGISGAAEPAWTTTGTVADGGVTWVCRAPPVWNSGKGYPRGACCRPSTPNGFCYVARVGGISGGSEPAWPTELGATITDGAVPTLVTWECTLYIEPTREFAQSAQAMGGL